MTKKKKEVNPSNSRQKMAPLTKKKIKKKKRIKAILAMDINI